MNTLGFNPAHHGSVCLLQGGEIKYFIQEERIGNRKKYLGYPFRSFIDILEKYQIDRITWGTPSIGYAMDDLHTPDFSYWRVIAWSYHPKIEYYDFSKHHHHTLHVAHSFYNSGFKKCIGVVIDGLGSQIKIGGKKIPIYGQETETIFECSYPDNFNVMFKNICVDLPLEKIPNLLDSAHINVSPNINLSRAYETITKYLGFSNNEAGKTMGLAPYGNPNVNISNFFIKNTGNPNIFIEKSEDINKEGNPQLKLSIDPKNWHYDESKITDLEKDIAWKVQNDTQQIVGDYIEKAIKKTGLKQVCCGGGYFLNCVTNYYLQKRFPDVEFYFEPIANDAGTAIGAAKLLWHKTTQDMTIRPLKSLYLGKQYSKEELLEGIKKYI